MAGKRKSEPAKADTDAPVVALLDQINGGAKQTLYTVARSGDQGVPVPEVLARGLEGSADVLLAVWRSWDIYATKDKDQWIIRADTVR